MLGDERAPRGYELWENAAGSWKHYEETASGGPCADGLRHLVECIHAGTRPAIPPEHAYHVLEVLHRARESAADGSARAITSTFEPLALYGVAGE
jgi:predicted dehydrogenase